LLTAHRARIGVCSACIRRSLRPSALPLFWQPLECSPRTHEQLLDEARQPALKWNFREGWPSKWEGPAFNAKNNDVAIETLEIAHEGLVQA